MKNRQTAYAPSEAAESVPPRPVDAALNDRDLAGGDANSVDDGVGSGEWRFLGAQPLAHCSPWRRLRSSRFRCWRWAACSTTSTMTISSWRSRTPAYLDIGLAVLFTGLSFAALSVYDRQALALVGPQGAVQPCRANQLLRLRGRQHRRLRSPDGRHRSATASIRRSASRRRTLPASSATSRRRSASACCS